MTVLSLIIPACDEADTIECCLRSIANQSIVIPSTIVVVANGCRDNTVEKVLRWVPIMADLGHRLEVQELGTASKPAALNHGDLLAGEGVRVYLDADIQLSPNALSAMIDVLHPVGEAYLCAPRLEFARSHSRITQSYAKIWTQLPYIKSNPIGFGLYAVCARGRQRWDEFPDIIADDKFVRLHFRADECAIAHSASFTVHLPEGFRELMDVRTRWCTGNEQLRRRFPDLGENDGNRYRRLPFFVAGRPRMWFDLALFVLIYLIAKARAWRCRGSEPDKWTRATRARQRISQLEASKGRL